MGWGARAPQRAPIWGGLEHPAPAYRRPTARLRRLRGCRKVRRHGLPRPRHDRGRRPCPSSPRPAPRSARSSRGCCSTPGAPCRPTRCWRRRGRASRARSPPARSRSAWRTCARSWSRGATAARRRRCSSATARATGWRSRRSRSTPTASSAACAPRPALAPAAALDALRRRARPVARRGRSPTSAGAEFAEAEIRRLEDLRSQAEEGRARALVELGRPLEAVPELRRLVAADPLREELACTLMLALYGVGPAGRGARRLPRPRGAASSSSGLAPGERGARARAPHPRAGPGAAPRPRRAARPRRRPASRRHARRPSAASASSRVLRGALDRAVARPAHGRDGARRARRRQEHARRRVPRAARASLAGVGQCLGHRGPGEPYMPVLEALGDAGARAGGRDWSSPRSPSARRRGSSSCRGCSTTAPDAEAVRHRAQGATRARMLREMLEALDAIGAAAPLVLVLEDLHWADDSTLDLLAAVLRRRDPARLLVVGTYRPVAGDGEPPVAALVNDLSVRGLVEELPVPRLGADAVAAYLRRSASRRAPVPDGPRRRARASGPAATRCSCATCSTTGCGRARSPSAAARSRSRGRARCSRPASRRRCARTSATSSTRSRRGRRAAASAASVAGRDFSAATLAAALDRDRERRRGALRRARRAHAADRAPRRRRTRSRTTCIARCSTSCSPPTRGRGCTPAWARTSPTRYGPAAADLAAELGFHFMAGRDPERARALPARRRRARVRPQRLPRGHPPPARRARRGRRAGRGLGADALGGRAALLARARRSSRRAAGRRPRPRTRCCARATSPRRLSDNEPLVSVLLALATLYELRGEFSRAQDMARGVPAARAERAGRARAGVLRAARLQPVPPGLLRARARVRRARRRAVRVGRRRATARTRASRPRSATTRASPATTGRAWRCGSSAAPTARWRGPPTRSSSRATPAARTAWRRRGRRWPSCTSAGASPRPRSSGRRRRSRAPSTSATSTARRWGACCAAGRSPLLGDPAQGIREITEGLAASRGTGARMDDPHYLALLAEAYLRVRRRRRRPGRRRRGARARRPRALAVLRARAAAARRRAARRRAASASARSRRCAAASRAPASRARRRSSCASPPTSRASSRTRPPPPRRAPLPRRRSRASRRASRTRDLREAAALLEAHVGA